MFLLFSLDFTMSSKKLSGTKVNVNYVESSIDLSFTNEVGKYVGKYVGAARVTISWLNYPIYHILVALTQFLKVNETVISIIKF